MQRYTMKKNIIVLSLFLISLLIISCSTDFDVNADYEVIPIVYCVLDPTTEYQYVKVNKAFLSDKPASEIAKISDSLFFNNVNVVLREYRNANFTGREWVFDKVEDIPKDQGFFASDRNTIYRKHIDFGNVDKDVEYEIIVNIENGQNIVKGRTKLVGGLIMSRPNDNTKDISLLNYKGSFDYKFFAGYHSNISQVSLTFNYIEVSNTDSVIKSVVLPLSKEVLSLSYKNNELTRSFSIGNFYSMLMENIKPVENIKRYVKMPNSIEFQVVSADDNYYTYSQVSAPSSSIVQHKPIFTNLEGGYGLIASRYNKYTKVKVSREMLDTIGYGIYTKNLGFVSKNNIYYQPFFPVE